MSIQGFFVAPLARLIFAVFALQLAGGFTLLGFLQSVAAAEKPKTIAHSDYSFSQLVKPVVLSRDADRTLSFEDVVESIKLRANKLNLVPAGTNILPRADQTAPGIRVAILGFCDPTLALEMVAIVPEFAVFLPCRIAVVQDASGLIRVLTVDWKADWFKAIQRGPKIPAHLLTRLEELLAKIADVVDSGARGLL